MSNDFNNQKQRAIDELLKMQQNAPSQQPQPKPQSNSPLGLDIPILNRLIGDGDLPLVRGLLLLLVNEKADKRLLFALLYILL